jgi:hypothetical protein
VAISLKWRDARGSSFGEIEPPAAQRDQRRELLDLVRRGIFQSGAAWPY